MEKIDYKAHVDKAIGEKPILKTPNLDWANQLDIVGLLCSAVSECMIINHGWEFGETQRLFDKWLTENKDRIIAFDNKSNPPKFTEE